jgi:hypothetical protein
MIFFDSSVLASMFNASFLRHSCSGDASSLLIRFKPTEHEGETEMRKNHSTGKLLGILATGISAAAIAFAATAGVAHPATHPSAAKPGPQDGIVLTAAPDPRDAATPNPWQE